MAEETPLEVIETFTTMTSGASGGVQYMLDNPTAFEDMLNAAISVINEFPDPEYKEKVNEVMSSMTPMISAVSGMTQLASTAMVEVEESKKFESGPS